MQAVSMKEHSPHIWMCFYNHKPLRKEWIWRPGIRRKLTNFEKRQIAGLRRYRNASHKLKVLIIKQLEST